MKNTQKIAENSGCSTCKYCCPEDNIKMNTPPEDYIDIDECVMSNFDSVIGKDIANRLVSEKIIAGYPGWNFYGSVWYEDNQYHCLVMTYGFHAETISSDTIEDLVESVCIKYGYE